MGGLACLDRPNLGLSIAGYVGMGRLHCDSGGQKKGSITNYTNKNSNLCIAQQKQPKHTLIAFTVNLFLIFLHPMQLTKLNGRPHIGPTKAGRTPGPAGK